MTAPVVATVASASSNSSSYAVSVPVGTANGDLLIGVVATDWGTAANNAFPAGWTALTTSSYDGGSNAFHILVYARVASSEPATYTVSLLDGADSVSAILRVTGWDSAAGIASAVKQIAPSTTGTGTTAPSLTPFSSDDLLITFHSAETSSGGSRTWTPPTGMTESVDAQSGIWTSLEVNKLANPATPSGTKVATPSAAVDTGAACTISIKAVGGGSSATATPAKTTTTVAVPQATPSAGSTKTPAVTVATVAAPQATPAVSDAATPASTSAVVALPQASVSAGATATPSPVSAVVAAPQATPSVTDIAAPAATPVAVGLPQATPVTSGNATVSPATIGVVAAFPQTAVSVATGPATLTATVALPQASPIAGGNVTTNPSPVAVVVGVPAALPRSGVVVTPVVVVAVVTVPRPAVGTAVGPASIAVLTTVPAASPATTSSVARTPATVTATVAVPHASAFAEGAGVRGQLGELSAELPGGIVAPGTFESGGTIR